MKVVLDLLMQTIVVAPPVLITAVGACISELSGVTNIGLEGMMLCGSFTAAVVNIYTGNPYFAIFMAIVVGGITACIHAVICIPLKGNQIISGVAINLFAVSITSYLIKYLFNAAGSTPSANTTANKMIVLIVIYTLAILTYFVIYKTVFGLRIRSVGEHPLAADTVGINVNKYRFIAVILSGMFAGLGGAYMTTVVLQQFINNMTAGRGYMAMAAMIFGKCGGR